MHLAHRRCSRHTPRPPRAGVSLLLTLLAMGCTRPIPAPEFSKDVTLVTRREFLDYATSLRYADPPADKRDRYFILQPEIRARKTSLSRVKEGRVIVRIIMPRRAPTLERRKFARTDTRTSGSTTVPMARGRTSSMVDTSG